MWEGVCKSVSTEGWRGVVTGAFFVLAPRPCRTLDIILKDFKEEIDIIWLQYGERKRESGRAFGCFLGEGRCCDWGRLWTGFWGGSQFCW